jgi:hypothetical protein
MSTEETEETATATPVVVGQTRTWPELAEELYERLTGRGAEISYEFENMALDVPSHAGPDAAHAHWRLDGTLRIRTRDQSQHSGPDQS